MGKSLRHIIWNLPPVDWALLADERRNASRKTLSGQKRPLDEVARMVAAKRSRAKARSEAASERMAERLKGERRRATGATARIVEAMQPGGWYARRDLQTVTGLAFNTICGCLYSLEQGGFVQRAANEEATPARYVTGVPVHLQPEAHPAPALLFSLTAKGQKRQIAARLKAACE